MPHHSDKVLNQAYLLVQRLYCRFPCLVIDPYAQTVRGILESRKSDARKPTSYLWWSFSSTYRFDDKIN